LAKILPKLKSAVSIEGIAGYPQEKFLSDLVNEAASDIR
jgi:hypothetical protein